jgi:hypothetical protein
MDRQFIQDNSSIIPKAHTTAAQDSSRTGTADMTTEEYSMLPYCAHAAQWRDFIKQGLDKIKREYALPSPIYLANPHHRAILSAIENAKCSNHFISAMEFVNIAKGNHPHLLPQQDSRDMDKQQRQPIVSEEDKLRGTENWSIWFNTFLSVAQQRGWFRRGLLSEMPLLRPGEVTIKKHATADYVYTNPLNDGITIKDIVPTMNLMIRCKYDDVWAAYLLNERKNMGFAILSSISRNVQSIIWNDTHGRSADGPICLRLLMDRFSQRE